MTPVPSLDALLEEIRRLPSPPGVVTDLIQALGEADAHIDRLAEGIARDQALTARVLRVANSPFYGLQRQVGSIHEAIVVLGVGTLGNLVTAAMVSGMFTLPAGTGLDLVRFWRHGMAAALCARALSAAAGLKPERCFTTGLLHDIGKLVMAIAQPDAYARAVALVEERHCPMHEAEWAVFGYDHARVGEALTECWHLPPDMVRGVARHHAPQDGPDSALVDVVHLGDVLAHALDQGIDPRAMALPVDPGVWQRRRLEGEAIGTLLEGVGKELDGYCLLLAQ